MISNRSPRLWILLGAVCALACASTSTPAEVTPPEVFVTDLAPSGGGLFEQRIRIDLRIANPNDFDLDLNGLSFTLDVNGTQLAQGMSNDRVTIPRLGESVVSVEASTTLVGLLHQVLRMTERRELAYELRGLVYLRDAAAPSLPFERSANLAP